MLKIDVELKKFEQELMNQNAEAALQEESATKDIKKLSNFLCEFFIEILS